MPWPKAIKPGVRSPFSILSQEALSLSNQTKGILQGELTSEATSDGKGVALHLDILAPVLQYRRRILTATHATLMLYPVTVDADCFRSPTSQGPFQELVEAMGRQAAAISALSPVQPGGSLALSEPRVRPANEAPTDEDFVRLVDQVLNSDEVKSLAVSLIALVNERLNAAEQQTATRREEAPLAGSTVGAERGSRHGPGEDSPPDD